MNRAASAIVGQHAAQRQVRLERLGTRPGGQLVVAPSPAIGVPSGASSRSRSGPRISKLQLLVGAAQHQHAPVGVDRPAADRVALRCRCRPRCAACETPGRARGSAGSAAPRSRRRAGRRRSSPAAAARARRSASAPPAPPAAVSPTLIIQISTSLGAPPVSTGFIVSETKISSPADRDLRPHRIGVLGSIVGRVVVDLEGERRVAGVGDRRSARARPPARRPGSRPRAPPRTPRRAAARCARDSSRCR